MGDFAKQCGRTVDNITALLAEGAMKLNGMRYAIAYLRDPAVYIDDTLTIIL
ncbi:hypothetical protein KL86DPRO_20222 [uncultured delta proteobacterium]|uniref:Uncharacterized protein n=1 Tax=uncultured delta proteobacterium TaxID=34034 RepID=A0A212JWV9_9DELT|nr:hypothetical protein KL86DPRO_20222 [uncultured delta proteobacterium]